MDRLTLGCRQVQARPYIPHTRARGGKIGETLHHPTPAELRNSLPLVDVGGDVSRAAGRGNFRRSGGIAITSANSLSLLAFRESGQSGVALCPRPSPQIAGLVGRRTPPEMS